MGSEMCIRDRFGTAEIEEAINQANNVVESAVVGFPHMKSKAKASVPLSWARTPSMLPWPKKLVIR